MRLGRFHMRSIPGPLALLPIIRYINYRFIPPSEKINNRNNISVDEQANIAGVSSTFPFIQGGRCKSLSKILQRKRSLLWKEVYC